MKVQVSRPGEKGFYRRSTVKRNGALWVSIDGKPYELTGEIVVIDGEKIHTTKPKG